ncbi:cysteine proteinase [Dentipellis sp. KUC8613]|nr:cysteine proteinase [Dentipellis sp. KUC8613]
MGTSKRHQRGLKAPPQMRRTTRSSKGRVSRSYMPLSALRYLTPCHAPLPRRLLTDPAENTQQLTSQLRQLGLYAANTLGDGNCLFRALSDQLYGSDTYHLQLRRDICDWIEKHKARYEPFVEDDRGIETHLRLMRQPATYGGHLELSAFAHMARRDVKVIQPGLVYVIEWASGWDLTPESNEPVPSSSSITPEDEPDDRSRRAARRERKRVEKEKPPPPPPPAADGDSDDESRTTGTVYVAYHDWEHFSSIRNLRGPHAGLPNVRETLVANPNDLPDPPSSKPKSKSKSKSASTDPSAPPSKPVSKPASRASRSLRSTGPPTPSQIPLPPSRSTSPAPSPAPRIRDQRSPKRTFDESSGTSEPAPPESHKRSKHAEDVDMDDISSSLSEAEVDAEIDADADDDTPALSESLSTASSTSSSPSPPPPPVERPLTRRQRKALGLPKPRPAVAGTRSAGKIVIPGGRFRKAARRGAAAAKDEPAEEEDGEWQRNGTGRMDVRGFRELRI